MSNYCACSGGDEEYTIELNQQGPEGPQGEVGPEGFSPSISVKTNTDKAYILTIVNKEGNFDTPNLYGELEKLNADLSNIPNPAYINGISLASIEDNIPMITMDSSRITTSIDGNLILNATASNEETMEVSNYEVVVNPKNQRLELHDNEGTVKIVATTDSIPTIDVATTEKAGIVKPDGSTITVAADGTISAVGVGGDVTAAGDNRFTGDNTFIGKVNIAGGALTVDGLATLNQATAQYLNAVSITSPGEINAVSIKANGLRSDDIQTTENKKYLTEVDVDNQTIQIVNGKLHANLDELGNQVNDLSDRVTTLQTSKQDTLTAGANITIVDNVISAIGGGGGGASIDDGSTSSVTTWSSSKINSEITTVAETKNDNIFDISKFTVVGTPTITDGGIASGFSTSNYLLPNLSAINTQNFELDIKYKTSSSYTTGVTNNIFYALNTSRNGNLQVYINASGLMKFDLSNYDGSVQAIDRVLVQLTQANTEYDIKIKITNGSLIEWFVNGTKVDEITKTQTNYGFIANAYSLGVRKIGSTIDRPFDGSIDLKQFSITVDGKKVFSGLMESTKPIYDKLSSTNTELSEFKTDTDNNFSAVNSALNEKANLSDLAGYVTINKYNELLARVVVLETEINGGNA